jgi:ATP-dependent RNA helicase DDX46/PRP5
MRQMSTASEAQYPSGLGLERGNSAESIRSSTKTNLLNMTPRRSRSRSPEPSSKRLKPSREDDRRRFSTRYEDEPPRPRHRDEDHRTPRLYRVDDSREHRRRDDDRDRYRRRDDRHRYDDRRDSRRHRRDEYVERDRDGRRASGASPRQGADDRSRSPRPRSSSGQQPSQTSPTADVPQSVHRANASLQKSQMTDVQRQRLEKMELWKKRKAAEAAAKKSSEQKPANSTNVSGTNVSPVPDSVNGKTAGSSLGQVVLNGGVDTAIAAFGFKLSTTRTAKNQQDLGLDEEEASRWKMSQLTPEDRANYKPILVEDDGEDTKLEDDDEDVRKHIKRDKIEDIKMDIDEGDRLPRRPTKPVKEQLMAVDEDPLDAFMHDVDKQARMIDEQDAHSFGTKTSSNTRVLMGQDDDDAVELNSDGELPEHHYAKEAKRAKTKDIATVDHSKVKYEPFKKDFYIPPPEYASMTPEEIADLRLELSGITLRGKDVPIPVTKWSQCGLNATMLDVINRLGYENPTPIQAQAIPAVMSGRDVIGVAQTGSGKTIAFLLPMFRHILNQRPLDKMEGPIALILSPTRELATQIYKDCKTFLSALHLRATCVYGGPPIKEQIAQMKAGAEIVVCTPGRMIDLLAANSGRVVNLQRVTYIVLDEADRQFDMGFEPQVMKIISNVRPDRQTVLFSATFPKQMEALARKVLKRPIEITVGNKSVVAPEIEQHVEVIKEEDKFNRLLGLLGDLYSQPDSEDDRALIFVDRQEGADFLLDRLLKRGYATLSLHGGKDQIDRDQVIKDFKDGAVPILTATSVAARGLDVKQLKLVINYDCPNHMEDYVHRVGRTGRAGQRGKAVTFITSEQSKYARDIVKALKLSGTPVPKDLEDLAAEWQKLVDMGRAYAPGSGFGGKGLDRFDQDRAAQKRLQRREHGDEDDEEEKVEDVFDEDGERKAPVPVIPPGPQNAAVAEAVAKVHQSLASKGQLRISVPIEPKLPDTGGETVQRLEINDLPQKARWAVTNRTNIAKVLEQTGVSITTKGSFFTNGRLPGPGEAKLHLLVEGETPVQVESAMRELRRLLSEASDAALVSREVPTGRYSVT